MLKFLESDGGHLVYINPNAIAYVENLRGGRCLIWLTSGKEIKVQGTAEEAVALIDAPVVLH